jgi:hypothetical protein
MEGTAGDDMQNTGLDTDANSLGDTLGTDDTPAAESISSSTDGMNDFGGDGGEGIGNDDTNR